MQINPTVFVFLSVGFYDIKKSLFEFMVKACNHGKRSGSSRPLLFYEFDEAECPPRKACSNSCRSLRANTRDTNIIKGDSLLTPGHSERDGEVVIPYKYFLHEYVD